MKKKESNQKHPLKNTANRRKEIVRLLRDLEQRNAEVEFVLPLAGASVTCSGRIVDTSFDDGKVERFHFISDSGIHAALLPQMLGAGDVEKETFRNGIFIRSGKGQLGFSIVEPLLKANAVNSQAAQEQLRTWQRLGLDLHVFLNRGGHAISVIAQVRELSVGLFSFTKAPTPVQLLVRLDAYKLIRLKAEQNKTSVTLINPRSDEICEISDAPTQIQTLFAKFKDVSAKIH